MTKLESGYRLMDGQEVQDVIEECMHEAIDSVPSVDLTPATGDLTLQTGNVTSGDAGNIYLSGGISTTNYGGSILLSGGNGVTGGYIQLAVGTGSVNTGQLLILNLPTEDPNTHGAVWVDTAAGNVLKISDA